MNARDELYAYADAAHLGGDYLDELLDRVGQEAAAKAAAETRKQAAREVFAERITTTPKGWSERYVTGWNDAIDAAVDKVRDGSQP